MVKTKTNLHHELKLTEKSTWKNSAVLQIALNCPNKNSIIRRWHQACFVAHTKLSFYSIDGSHILF